MIRSEYKALQKDQALATLYPVSSVKERNRKGGKCKISRVLQSPVSSPQASPEVEASNRLKQAQHFSTRRKVQNGNSRVHQDLPDSRGMGIVDRPIGRLPSHPHPPKLKEIPKVLPQVAGVPVHLPPFQSSHSPPGLYNDCKGSEANGPLPDPNAWDIDALNINWTGLTAYAYPPTAPLHRVIQKNQAMPLPDHCNSSRLARDALVFGPSAALNRDPTSTSSINNSSQTVPQLCVPQQSTTSQPPRLVSRSEQLQEQGFSVEVAERIAAHQSSSTRTITGYSPVFTGIVPKVPGIFQNGTFLLYSMSSQKHPLSL